MHAEWLGENYADRTSSSGGCLSRRQLGEGDPGLICHLEGVK